MIGPDKVTIEGLRGKHLIDEGTVVARKSNVHRHDDVPNVTAVDLPLAGTVLVAEDTHAAPVVLRRRRGVCSRPEGDGRSATTSERVEGSFGEPFSVVARWGGPLPKGPPWLQPSRRSSPAQEAVFVVAFSWLFLSLRPQEAAYRRTYAVSGRSCRVVAAHNGCDVRWSLHRFGEFV